MKKALNGWLLAALAGGLAVGGLASSADRTAQAAQRERGARSAPVHDLDDPEVSNKIVPILTFGSNLNVGAAQVSGPAERVREVKAVAQLETDYKDWARIKILVPVSTERVIQNIERVPGVSVTGVADVRLSD